LKNINIKKLLVGCHMFLLFRLVLCSIIYLFSFSCIMQYNVTCFQYKGIAHICEALCSLGTIPVTSHKGFFSCILLPVFCCMWQMKLHLIFSSSCANIQTDRQTDRHTERIHSTWAQYNMLNKRAYVNVTCTRRDCV